MAYALVTAAPFIDEDGNYKEPESNLSGRWKGYHKKYQVARNQERAEKKRRTEEVQSFRFDITEIDAAWNGLTKGQVPEAAARIWRASYPRKSAHEIAKDADVSLRDFVFWMCVFKRNLHMHENIVAGTHMYYRQQSEGDLSSVVSAVSSC